VLAAAEQQHQRGRGAATAARRRWKGGGGGSITTKLAAEQGRRQQRSGTAAAAEAEQRWQHGSSVAMAAVQRWQWRQRRHLGEHTIILNWWYIVVIYYYTRIGHRKPIVCPDELWCTEISISVHFGHSRNRRILDIEYFFLSPIRRYIRYIQPVIPILRTDPMVVTKSISY
jgi:hypothetical protein